MKLDKNKLKQKIKDIGVEHGLKISAACGVICGIIGLTAAEYYRREYNSLLAVDLDDDWTSIDVPKEALENMMGGAVMKIRSKTDGRNTKTQITTADDFSDEANARFDQFA